jgi:hypothetical protein
MSGLVTAKPATAIVTSAKIATPAEIAERTT